MKFLFCIPILVATVLGVTNPFVALSLIRYSFLFLFLLLILAGITIDWKQIRPRDFFSRVYILPLFLHYFIFPLLILTVSKFLISDPQMVTGLFVASLTPAAIVVPFFVSFFQKHVRRSFIFMIYSMILCPFVTPFMLRMFSPTFIDVELAPLFLNILILNTAPLLIAYLIQRYVPNLSSLLKKNSSVLNISCLSILIFILSGASMGKMNTSFISYIDITFVMLIALMQDFGVFYLILKFGSFLGEDKSDFTFPIGIGLKNIAIGAGILLFYDPRSAFPIILGFIAHSLFFSMVPIYAKVRSGQKTIS